jgi:hypothetical protein
MPAIRRGLTMMDMPAANSDLTRRALVEVAAAASATSSKDPVVRRYRLARVPLYTRPAPALDRFAHLRRSYD